jgi:Ala-tRNA(Pro) deacylase
MPAQRLKEYLNKNNIKYISIMHSPAYTAQGIAHSAHISGKELAKTVIVKSDGEMIMVVMPANHKVNLEQFKGILHADVVELACEEEFKFKFSDCELGAMPPFGNLYNMDVYVSDELTKDKEIAFNAGSHTELIRMEYEDFEKLVQPKVVSFSGE